MTTQETLKSFYEMSVREKYKALVLSHTKGIGVETIQWCLETDTFHYTKTVRAGPLPEASDAHAFLKNLYDEDTIRKMLQG